MVATAGARRGAARLLAMAAALVLITVGLYTGVAGHDFAFDDFGLVVGNPVVSRGLTRDGLVWAFTQSYRGNWHPLTWLTHMLAVSFFGLTPLGPHLMNVALHALNGALLLLLLTRLGGSPGRAAVAAVLFAVHPTRVEAVAWISERKELLAAGIGFLVLWVYLDWLRRGGAGRYWAAVALHALGLMAKPTLVSLPVLMLSLDFWPLGRLRVSGQAAGRPMRLLLEKTPFVALAAASSVITLLSQRKAEAVLEVPFLLRAANACIAYPRYLAMLVWPVGLSPYYPYGFERPSSWQVVGALLMLAGVTAAALLAARRAPYLTAGWFWFIVALLPMIGLVQVGSQALADRYAYLPFIGLFVLAAWSVPARISRAPLAWLAGLAVVTALASLTVAQVRYWRNDVTLFGRAVAVTRENYVARSFLGQALTRARRGEEALPQFAEALRINPESLEAELGMGQALASLGRLEEAETHYRAAMRISPDYAKANVSLAMLLSRMGRRGEAAYYFRRAVRLDPNMAATIGPAVATGAMPGGVMPHRR